MGSLLLQSYCLETEPMESDIFDFLLCFNEGVLTVCMYLMFIFTDYVGEPETRYYFGYYFLYLFYFNLAINLVLLVYEVTIMVKRECSRYWSHRALRRQRKLKVQ